MVLMVLVKYEVSLYLNAVSFPEVVRQIMLDLSDELLGVVGIQAEHLAEAFEADVLQVTVSQSLHTGVGLNHFLLCQIVRANQVAPTWRGETNVELDCTDFNLTDLSLQELTFFSTLTV